ncbi:hypothetical protein ACFQ1E_11095 [Sphingomonas canadensis]|uniref:Uncharacterized protein n=1 Tax=Sphingomonas canadensis TaxID=1219257 RepID=A0ABW3H862_9SPHN|nr:hypothetical protein [Sphingomonas canadensis]MCW3836334.1 hypothetical protein [Sphingomonas canadensis]
MEADHTGSLKCMATTTTGSQTFIMYTDADGNSGVQLLSPEAQAQTLGEDGTLDTALDGGDPIDFMITIENYGGKKVFDIPISLDIMVMDLTEGFTIDASWKGYDVFSMDLRRAGTEEVFREMIACEDGMKGDSEDDG